jgi:putative ABC transport system permease protein
MTLGVAIYITMTTAFYNLSRSQETFYQEYDFADYYFHIIKAPEGILNQVKDVPGVLKATGRIEKDVPIVKENDERATARLISYPLPMDREINRLHLLSGRLFDSDQGTGIPVLADPQYKEANNLKNGQKIEIIAEGKKVPLTMVGTAISPEYIYPMKDANTMFPNPKEFGIIMMEHEQAQQILNMQGQINQVVVKLAPGTDEEIIKKHIEKIIEPYGNLASYPRKDQLSNAAMQAEIDGIGTASVYLPLIFFIIAIAIQFVLLNRLIKSQRLQIGVMKALGYDNLAIIMHFTGYALSVTAVGFLLGTVFGILMASGVSEVYALFFNLPQTIGGINTKAVVYSLLISTAVGITAGITASWRITSINPAEVMRPEPPVSGGAIIIERWKWLWKKLNTPWKMSLRSIFRNRIRFAITTLGITSAVALLVLAQFSNDSVDYMLDRYYSHENRYDLMIHFATPIKEDEILNWRYWDGVLRVEPLLELPVEMKAKGLAGNSETNVLMGLNRDSELKTVFSDKGEIIQVPEEGLVINERTAKKLNLKVGDKVELETKLGLGPSQEARAKVVGINEQLFMAGGAFSSLEAANRILKEQNVITGAMLKVNPELEPTIEKRLNNMTGVASVMSKQNEQDNLMQLMDSMIYFIGVMFFFAIVLGLAIVYNSSMMAFNERTKELTSLRVIGLTHNDVSGLLFKETFLQSLAGVAVGLPAGRIMGEAYVKAVSTDLYSMPVIVYPESYIQSVLIALVFIFIGHLLAVRRLKNIDLVEVLKNRD